MPSSPAADEAFRFVGTRFDIMTGRVAAVVVTFRPDCGQLAALLRAVQPQVDRVLAVDNTPGGFPCPAVEGAELIALGRNAGLAAAQNRGIRRALELDCDFVLLLDQDSTPDGSMVRELLAAHTRLLQRGENVAAVGPRLIDARSGASQPVVQTRGLRMRFAYFDEKTDLLETEFLVASGSLLSRNALERVGLMDETLFMDQIDVEWELRARSLGMKLYAAGRARLNHNLGLGDRRIWFLRFHQVPVHAPLRNYYLFRNTVEIFFRRPAPLVWRVDRFKALLIMGFGYATQVAPRALRLRMIVRGLRDAVRGRKGELVP